MGLKPQGYLNRLVDAKISAMLNAFGAVVIDGPQ